MQNEIRLVRLKNGEDVIGYVTDVENGQYNISEPMSVGIDMPANRQPGLLMRSWLPVQLIKTNEAVISNTEIMFMMEPDAEFCEYYVHTVEKIKEMLSAKKLVDSLSDDEVDDMMHEFEEFQYNGDTLH